MHGTVEAPSRDLHVISGASEMGLPRLLSSKGRASRAEFWLRGWLPCVCLLGLAAMLARDAGTGQRPEWVQLLLTLFSLAFCLVAFLFVWYFLALTMRRCHDRGRPIPFLLLGLVPGVNIWAVVDLLFIKGTTGNNRFGRDPLAEGEDPPEHPPSQDLEPAGAAHRHVTSLSRKGMTLDDPETGTVARPYRTIRIMVGMALLFIFLMRFSFPNDPERTWLWFLTPILMALYLSSTFEKGRKGIRRAFEIRRFPKTAFVCLAWMAGMMLELGLSEGGNSYGGLHPKTVPSFILAQCYYIPISLFGLLLIRRYHYTPREVYFAGGLCALYEMLAFGVAMMATAPWGAPLTIAYYYTLYATFWCFPLVFIDVESLWSPNRRAITFRRKLLYGAAVGILNWMVAGTLGGIVKSAFSDFEGF